MNGLAAGAIGAATTNILHEVTRRVLPDAPRVDLLGMQALQKMVATQSEPPKGNVAYALTLAGDLLSNSLYFGLLGFAPRGSVVLGGALLGAAAGVGAVILPGPLGLREDFTARTTVTKASTIAFYLAGGLASGLALRLSNK